MKGNFSSQQKVLRKGIVGRFLRRMREKAKLTQTELARSLSYRNAQFVSNWERGVSLPPLHMLPRLIKSCSIPARELVEVFFRYETELAKLESQRLRTLLAKYE